MESGAMHYPPAKETHLSGFSPLLSSRFSFSHCIVETYQDGPLCFSSHAARLRCGAEGAGANVLLGYQDSFIHSTLMEKFVMEIYDALGIAAGTRVQNNESCWEATALAHFIYEFVIAYSTTSTALDSAYLCCSLGIQ